MREAIKTLGQVLGILVIMTVSFGLGWYSREVQIEPPARVEPWLPSLTEVQQRVGVRADNIYGKQTREAWERYYAEQTIRQMEERRTAK